MTTTFGVPAAERSRAASSASSKPASVPGKGVRAAFAFELFSASSTT